MTPTQTGREARSLAAAVMPASSRDSRRARWPHIVMRTAPSSVGLNTQEQAHRNEISTHSQFCQLKALRTQSKHYKRVAQGNKQQQQAQLMKDRPVQQSPASAEHTYIHVIARGGGTPCNADDAYNIMVNAAAHAESPAVRECWNDRAVHTDANA